MSSAAWLETLTDITDTLPLDIVKSVVSYCSLCTINNIVISGSAHFHPASKSLSEGAETTNGDEIIGEISADCVSL